MRSKTCSVPLNIHSHDPYTKSCLLRSKRYNVYSIHCNNGNPSVSASAAFNCEQGNEGEYQLLNSSNETYKEGHAKNFNDVVKHEILEMKVV